MTFQIKVAGTEFEFPCAPEETVLDAAERAGFSLPYSCRKGVCSTCEGRVLEGQAQSTVKGLVDGPADDVQLCCARPRSDLTIAPQRITRREPQVRKTVVTTVYRLTRPAPDVAVLHLRFPPGTRCKFKAGQYLSVIMDDGSRRSFSMANPPHESDGVQLHIRHVPGGHFSEKVLAGLAAGQKLKVELPFGEFYFREDTDKPVILLASGTGFAPIKSIVDDAIKRGIKRPMHVYWGGRREQDLYAVEVTEKWAKQAPHITFIPVLSEADAGWTGRTGFVHLAVLEDHPDMSGFQVYACGAPIVTSSAREDFTGKAGLPPEEFFCDAFVASGGPAETQPGSEA